MTKVITDCMKCLSWEWVTFGMVGREAYATTAMAKDMSARELRAKILEEVHKKHKIKENPLKMVLDD